MKIFLLLMMIAATVFAGEIPVPFDKLSNENVRVKTQVEQAGTGKLTVEISPIGASAEPATIEVYTIMGSGGFFYPYGMRCGKQVAEVGAGKYEFDLKNPRSSVYLDGWFVRVVRDGKIIGYAASSQSEEKLVNPDELEKILGKRRSKKYEKKS